MKFTTDVMQQPLCVVICESDVQVAFFPYVMEGATLIDCICMPEWNLFTEEANYLSVNRPVLALLILLSGNLNGTDRLERQGTPKRNIAEYVWTERDVF